MTSTPSRPLPTMPRDVRDTASAEAVQSFYGDLFRPGTEHVHAVRDLNATNAHIYFTGLDFAAGLDAGPEASLYRFDRAGGNIQPVRRAAQMARPAPDGTRIALVEEGGIAIVDAAGFERILHRPIDGVIEKLAWSPDGRRLALLVAGAGADVSGAEGGYALRRAETGESWLPEVDSGDAADVWRRILIWSPAEDWLEPVTAPPVNVWEFSWENDGALIAVASDHHGEGSWYGSTLRRIDLSSGTIETLYRPNDQIGLPRSAPDGAAGIALIEAVCSDRGIVCGLLRLVENGVARTLDTGGVDVSDLSWLSPTRIAYAGLRGLETVVGEVDLATGAARDRWASLELTCGEWHPALTASGDDLFVHVEAYAHPPALAQIGATGLEMLHSFAATDAAAPAGRIEPICWRAADGLEIHGWLVSNPEATQPAPLLVDIHGGPIWAHRNRWAARMRANALLVARGWSVLLPNMRGAPGWGQDFARRVAGDMGGIDAGDIVDGVERLVADGRVDRTRVAVTGASYGGFMSSCLVTRHDWLAAAIPISPVTNWYSQHYTSQIPSFDEAFLIGSPREPGAQYFERSPAFFATGAKTPTLILAGARDKNTPPTQALEFHHALIEAGCPSILVTYPEDGHSLRGYPAYLDSAARVLLWLEQWV